MVSGMPPHSTNTVNQTGLLINDWDAKLSIGIKQVITSVVASSIKMPTIEFIWPTEFMAVHNEKY